MVSISGFKAPLPLSWGVEPAETLPDNHACFYLDNEVSIAEVWGTRDAGGNIELIFDEEGNPVDVKCIMPE